MKRRDLFKALAATALLAVATTTRLGETALRVEPPTMAVRTNGYDEEKDEAWVRYDYTAPDGTEFYNLFRSSGGDYVSGRRASDLLRKKWLDSRDRLSQATYERWLDHNALESGVKPNLARWIGGRTVWKT